MGKTINEGLRERNRGEVTGEDRKLGNVKEGK